MNRTWFLLLVCGCCQAIAASPARADCEPTPYKDLLLQSVVVAAGRVVSVKKESANTEVVSVSVDEVWRGQPPKVLTFKQSSIDEEDDSPIRADRALLFWGLQDANGQWQAIKSCGAPLDPSPTLKLALNVYFGKPTVPADVKGLIKKAAAMIAANAWQEAGLVLESVSPTSVADEASRYFHWARLAAVQHDFYMAIFRADLAARLDPEAPEARFNLACYAARGQKTDLALRTLEELVDMVSKKDATVKKRFSTMVSSDQDLASLHKSARFQRALARLEKS